MKDVPLTWHATNPVGSFSYIHASDFRQTTNLETVVQDWKRKLEVIVAEGLKTIKKTTKERKMMMKYLPGDSLIGG